MRQPLIAPSILAADFSHLGKQLAEAREGGADLIHIDVMDGHFVPNITLGPLVVEACRRATELPLDVHLMIQAPERFIDRFARAGAACLTVHAEAAPHLHRLLQMIHHHEIKAGLAVNPLTPLTVFEEALPYLDRALIMSVNPGFGGQAFIPASLSRIARLKKLRDALNPGCEIEVDGGVVPENSGSLHRAGTDILVAGSAIFNQHASVRENLAALRRGLLTS